jgi:hypothetical protein
MRSLRAAGSAIRAPPYFYPHRPSAFVDLEYQKIDIYDYMSVCSTKNDVNRKHGVLRQIEVFRGNTSPGRDSGNPSNLCSPPPSLKIHYRYTRAHGITLEW